MKCGAQFEYHKIFQPLHVGQSCRPWMLSNLHSVSPQALACNDERQNSCFLTTAHEDSLKTKMQIYLAKFILRHWACICVKQNFLHWTWSFEYLWLSSLVCGLTNYIISGSFSGILQGRQIVLFLFALLYTNLLQTTRNTLKGKTLLFEEQIVSLPRGPYLAKVAKAFL